MRKTQFTHKKPEATTRLNETEEGMPKIRLGMRVGEFSLELLAENDSPWFETKEETQSGLESRRRKQVQLARIKLAMYEHLKESDISIIELRFFHGLTLRQIGVIMDLNASTVHRRIRNSILTLKKHLTPEQ